MTIVWSPVDEGVAGSDGELQSIIRKIADRHWPKRQTPPEPPHRRNLSWL